MSSNRIRFLLSAGLLAGGFVGSPAAHALLVTTAEVSLVYEDSSTRLDFHQTDGGEGVTHAIEQVSLPLTSGFAEALLPPGPGVPAVLLRASAAGNRGPLDPDGNGPDGGGFALARITTDEIVFTTPANSLGSQFAVGLDFDLSGRLLAGGTGSSYADLAVLFFSPDVGDTEGLKSTHFLFRSEILGSGPISAAQSGFTSYGGVLLLDGADQAADFRLALDIQLTVGAGGGPASADFADTFTAKLAYDPALILTSPFNAPVPEPSAAIPVALGSFSLLAFRRRS